MRVNCPNVAGFRAAAMFAHIAGYACPASVFIDGGAMRDVRQLRAAAVVILKSREIVQPGGGSNLVWGGLPPPRSACWCQAQKVAR